MRRTSSMTIILEFGVRTSHAIPGAEKFDFLFLSVFCPSRF